MRAPKRSSYQVLPSCATSSYAGAGLGKGSGGAGPRASLFRFPLLDTFAAIPRFSPQVLRRLDGLVPKRPKMMFKTRLRRRGRYQRLVDAGGDGVGGG